MFKASIELGKVSSIKIKFGLIIEGDDDKKYNYNNKLMIIRDVLDKSIKNKCLKIIANGKYQRIKKIKY